jgi:hypothetical protein
MSNLFDFMIALATDPKRQLAFAHAPAAVMEAAGLAKTDRVVLESRDGSQIAAIYAHELPEPAFCVWDPNPDPMPDPDPPPDAESSQKN